MRLASAAIVAALLSGAAAAEEPRQPLLRTVDLDVGQAQEVELADAPAKERPAGPCGGTPRQQGARRPAGAV